MTKLILVRHAATDWSGTRFCGTTDLPLSAAGRTQVTELARWLTEARLLVPALRSSPARRAVETAVPIADALGASLDLDDRLREVDFGLAEGRTFAEIERQWPAIARSLLADEIAIDWPDGERASDVRARLRLVARQVGTRPDSDLVLVMHGGSIRFLAALFGLAPEASADLAPARCFVLEREPSWHLIELAAASSDVRGGERLWRPIRT